MGEGPRITPCLWFNFNAEEAVAHYLSVFEDSRITALTRYGEGQPGPAGAAMTIAFEIDGQSFLALNGGPQFPFTPAISLMVNCADQREIDGYWERLSEGGAKGRRGWLTDRFGVSWQIVPREVEKSLTIGDPARAQRVMRAVMKMDKLEIAVLRTGLCVRPRRRPMSEAKRFDKGKFVWYEYMGHDSQAASRILFHGRRLEDQGRRYGRPFPV